MKLTISLLFVLIFSAGILGQVKKSAASTNYVQVEITDDGATSELLPMPIGMSPNLTDAKVGIKYFGTQSDSDISFVLILKGTKSRYSAKESFGVQFLIDDVPINSNKYRKIESVDKEADVERLHIYITTEDLAWLATAKTIKIAIFKTETDTRLDTLFFKLSGVNELKKFAKSVYLIRSKI